MNKTWENHEKYRADLLKFVGIILCTPFCGIIFEQLVHGFYPSFELLIRSFIALTLVFAGLKFIARSRIVIYNLDKEISHAKLNSK